MIGSLGIPEIIAILWLALIIFGPRKLPDIGRTLGKALGEFRRATTDLKRTLDTELSAEELNPPVGSAAPTSTEDEDRPRDETQDTTELEQADDPQEDVTPPNDTEPRSDSA